MLYLNFIIQSLLVIFYVINKKFEKNDRFALKSRLNIRLNVSSLSKECLMPISRCSTFKPYFDPDPESQEILINEGESLDISCVSTRHIQIFYPLSDDLTRTITSEHEITFEKQNSSFARWTFRRNKTVFGDTGWYGCADIVAKIFHNNHNHPNASFIYVYVQSNISGFTEISQSNRTIFVDSELLTLPCRPTSPYLNVTLIGNDVKNPYKKIHGVSFDPKTGFQLNISLQQDYTDLQCYTTDKNVSYIISYKIKKSLKFFHKNAKIAFKDRYLFNGSLLKGMCSIHVETNVNITCYFSWPRTKINTHENSTDNSFRVELAEEYKIGPNLKEVVFSFNIFDITFNDMGMYTCSFLSDKDVSTVKKHVSVQDEIDFRIFTINNNEVIEGQNITLGCSIRYEKLYVSSLWKDSYLRFLENSAKFKVFQTRSISYITIFNLSKIDETTIICTDNNQNIFDANPNYFDLIIKRPKPAHFLDTNLNGTKIVIQNGTRPNQPILKCVATGVPKPIITWYKNGVELKENVNLKSLQVHYKQAMTRYLSQNENKILIITEVLRNADENYSCIAKNPYGQVEAYQVYTVRNSLSNNSLIWIFITGLLMILFITFGISIYIKNNRQKIRKRCLQEIRLLGHKNGGTNLLNPELMIHNQIDLLPYDEKWEFNKENLKLEHRLGSGSFGVVMKAKAYGIKCGEKVTDVAVKMVHPHAESYQIQALANELKVMIYVGDHLNIVNLLGVYRGNIIKRELFVIVEYCRYGNLHDYLYKQRKRFINQIDPKTGIVNFSDDKVAVPYSLAYYSHSPNISNPYLNKKDDEHLQDIVKGDVITIKTHDLLHWSLQVASGMEYISSKKVIHGDLAARNILLTQNNIVKICDFGLGKIIYEDENYIRKSHGCLPFKWLAPESIIYREFSSQSDVWSFGIVIWEFFTLAKVPYHQMNAQQQVKKLLEGYRLHKPKYATNDIYKLMLHCWNDQADLRPTFSELVEKIKRLL